MKRQRTIAQIKEKGKTPENQLSDEILSIQEKDFRLLMIKMMQDIGNKLEAKMDNLQQTLSKETRDLRVPTLAQGLRNPTRNHEVAGSIPGLSQCVKDLALP